MLEFLFNVKLCRPFIHSWQDIFNYTKAVCRWVLTTRNGIILIINKRACKICVKFNWKIECSMILFNKTEECFYLIVLDDLRPNIQRINNTCLRYATLLKRDFNTCAFCEYCESFKNAYFEEYLQAAASGTEKSYCFFEPKLILLNIHNSQI